MSRKIELGRAAGYFSIFKRDVIGIYQHCGEKDRQRYLHEFDFRYSNRAALGVDRAHQPRDQGHGRQAAYLSTTSSRASNKPRLTRKQFRAILARIKRGEG
jgi:hypothetical protein